MKKLEYSICLDPVSVTNILALVLRNINSVGRRQRIVTDIILPKNESTVAAREGIRTLIIVKKIPVYRSNIGQLTRRYIGVNVTARDNRQTRRDS